MLDPLQVDGRGSQPHVLMASVVSIREGVIVDDACLLHPGDHPFIEHASFVDYRFTRVEPAKHVETCTMQGVFVPKEDCSDELLRRIVAGALRSKRISREFKQLLEKVVFG
ncbi:hypothetical protein [Pseudorhodoferax sp.]|uniref:hypothetical protein n=1 Tax=Pseudorhodoferax sp. TaxID=1993553 RepID=UPI002DD68FA9|nr:hypothetical protein [Pseudorhodoferax sp.]